MLKSRFKKDEKGASAIEYAIVLPILILFIFSIIEYGFLMFITSTFNNSVSEASRVAMTGSDYKDRQNLVAQGGKYLTRDQFVEKIMNDKMSGLISYGLPCTDPSKKICISTKKSASIEDVNYSGTTGYGSSGEVVIYTISFSTKVLSPILMPFLGQNGRYTVTANTVMQNEEF